VANTKKGREHVADITSSPRSRKGQKLTDGRKDLCGKKTQDIERGRQRTKGGEGDEIALLEKREEKTHQQMGSERKKRRGGKR